MAVHGPVSPRGGLSVSPHGGLRAAALAALLAASTAGCTGTRTVTHPVSAATQAALNATAEAASPAPAAGTLRARVAAVALRQVAFGALSLIPVRFEKSRISGPFEDGGRTLYCVTSHMTGRTFGKAERAKAVIRDEGGSLRALDDEDEVCEGHRTEPFPELEAAGNPAAPA